METAAAKPSVLWAWDDDVAVLGLAGWYVIYWYHREATPGK